MTQYVQDRTQGPACSVSCGPATVVRNYFVPVPGKNPDDPPQEGQTENRMLNNLVDFCRAAGNEDERFFKVVGGYTMIDGCPETLADFNKQLEEMDKDALLETIRVGVHRNVEVCLCDRVVFPIRCASDYICWGGSACCRCTQTCELPGCWTNAIEQEQKRIATRRPRACQSKQWHSCVPIGIEFLGLDISESQVTSKAWGKVLDEPRHTITQVFASATAVGCVLSA